MFKKEKIIKSIRERTERDFSIVGKVGATIKLKRQNKKQTLSNLSQLFGVSISYLSKVENDVMKPNIDYLTDVLYDLEINEDIIHDSIEMNLWYEKLIIHVLDIKDHKDELLKIINQREDFQSKGIKFSLDVYNNEFSNILKTIKMLLPNITLMHETEFCIFMFSLASYYIKVENHFMAGLILKEINQSYIHDNLLNLWYLELKHELALYQSSFSVYMDAVNELNNYYFLFNLKDKAEELKERSTAALAYFLEPNNFKDFLHDEQMYRSYRLSMIYSKQFDDFNKLEKRNDLAQVLYDEINEKYDKVKNNWSKVEYKDDPLEQAIKEYFKYKYDFDKLEMFLKETFFANTGLNQHHYSSNFIADYLIDYYSSKHQYKQCYLIGKKLKELTNERYLYLEDKRT